MKKLYEFTVLNEELVDDTVVSKAEDGSEIKTITKVKKEIPRKFFIRKPNRTLFDEGQLFYSAYLSEFIRKGLMTRAMLAKRYAEDNGIWSEKDRDEYANLYIQLVNLQQDIKSLTNNENKDNPDAQEPLAAKQKNLKDVVARIQKFEQAQMALFEETAENKARDKSIVWWVLFLSYNEDDKPIFGEGDFKAKLLALEDIEEKEDKFLSKVIGKLSRFIGLWYIGIASTKEEFEAIDKEFENDALKK